MTTKLFDMIAINTLTIVGIILIVIGMIQLIIPPKFGSILGLKTNLTTKNIDTWLYAQRTFSVLMMIFGFIIIVAAQLNYNITVKTLAPLGFIAFWFLSKNIIDQLISKKFPNIH